MISSMSESQGRGLWWRSSLELDPSSSPQVLSPCGFEEGSGEEEVSPKRCRQGKREGGRPAMHYVYILVSLNYPTRYYIGRTENLEIRLQQHNRGESGYSKRYAP